MQEGNQHSIYLEPIGHLFDLLPYGNEKEFKTKSLSGLLCELYPSVFMLGKSGYLEDDRIERPGMGVSPFSRR